MFGGGGGYLSRGDLSQGVYVLVGKCPGGRRGGGKCPGGKCPGGICPLDKCPGGTCPEGGGGYVLELSKQLDLHPNCTHGSQCQKLCRRYLHIC